MNQDEADYGDRTKPLDPTKPLVERPGLWRALASYVVCGCLSALLAVALMYVVSTSVSDAANRMNSSGKLCQIGLALHNYHDTYGSLPTNSYAPDGTPLLSWRVYLLPYLESDQLYSQFHLDEPWDSPRNRRLLPLMPKSYRNPREAEMPGYTHYRSFGHAGAVMEPRFTTRLSAQGNLPLGLTFDECTRGRSNTILVIEAGTPVEWTKPDDLDASATLPLLGGNGRKGYAVQYLLGDGSVHRATHPLNDEQLQTQTMYAAAATAKVP